MPSTRRAFLASAAAAGVGLAGCSTLTGTGDPDDPPEPGVDDPPEPDRHIYGADGEWGRFGCDASHTREVDDGKAPVDGVSERWRVPVPQLGSQEPAVAGGRVFALAGDELRVLDAADGSELWTDGDANRVPLVWDGVAYTVGFEGIRALDAETGESLWERSLSERVAAPSTYAGEELLLGAGETVLGLDPETGEERWRRDVFGQVVDYPAVFSGYSAVVATEAGMVYLIGQEGTGVWRWQLPARPTCPPSADSDSIYVTCRNGTTYALMDDGSSDRGVFWSVDTGWAERGIGVAQGLTVVANGRGLQAIDSESGEHRWEQDIGDWRHTAPAFGRDTLFVGGDRLRAFDPTPGDSPSGGPALRFEKSYHGRVGPGPVIDDGVLYVVAQVAEDEHALLALE